MPFKDQLKVFNVDALWRRALLVVPAALALYGAWTIARWHLGNMLASNPPEVEAILAAARTRPNDPGVREALGQVARVLHAAERFAPDDPQVHYTLGVFARRSFEPEELQEALKRFERATALSPNDYRLWMELGRSRGQAGDVEGGERALRHAVALAPHYSMPHWYLGNLRLRAGREREAFDELRRAAEIDPRLHAQIFTTAWSYFGGDIRAVADAVGDSTEARSRLVEHLVSQKRLDDALFLWGTLKAGEKTERGAAGKRLTSALVEAGRMRKALEVYRDWQPEGGQEVAVGQMVNGGFEQDVGAGGANPFEWVVRPVPQAQMGLDARNVHGGARSLRIAFSAPHNFGLGQFTQLILVEPQARYRLTYFFRTEDLKSAATLVFAVLDVAGHVLAASAPVPSGTSDWREVALEFATPPQGEAITAIIVRAPCPDESCPIFGKVWYDDFNLQRVGGGAGARAPRGR